MRQEARHQPFRAAESEAVGELSTESIPVLLLLLIRQLEQGVVESLEVLVLLDDGWVRAPVAVPSTTAAAASSTSSASTTTFTLWNYESIEEELRVTFYALTLKFLPILASELQCGFG